MLSLERVLIDYDLGLLRVIAELWGVELTAAKQREAAEQLAAHMLEHDHLAEMISSLPAAARNALTEVLREREGRTPLARFTRDHGELRAMGPARREREQPWRNAPSATETLWYRGLLARAFFDSEGVPQEYLFVPEDLRQRLALQSAEAPAPIAIPPGAPADVADRADGEIRPALALTDDLTTLLAYAQVLPINADDVNAGRDKLRAALRRFLYLPEALSLDLQLAFELQLLAGPPAGMKPEGTKARPFLESPRLAQARALAEAWRASKAWNDLRQLPGLIFEGQAWQNDPVAAREAILTQLAAVPPGEWWSLDAFVAAVKERSPDFQRPAGDYDSWYIRDAATQDYLRGFAHWDRIDGALVRYLIQQPLYWLGVVEITGGDPHPQPLSLSGRGVTPFPRRGRDSGWGEGGIPSPAFRITAFGSAFLRRAEDPTPEPEPEARVSITTDGLIRVPTPTPAYDRFRIARITKWVALDAPRGEYSYRLTPSSLKRAVKQGVSVDRITAFLQQLPGEEPAPPLLLSAIQRWARNGAEAVIKETFVLKLSSPELLELLQHTPPVGRLLGRPLGPAAVEVRREDAEALRSALAELGILSD
jgi:hypothetical protein